VNADLHIHSTVSDGSDTIEQIIETAKSKGLDAIAITDHDTLSHLQQIPVDADIKVVGGVEISAIHQQTKTRAHILGYKIQKPELLTALTRKTTIDRSRNSEKQVNILYRLGYKLNVDKLARADRKYLYKQHIMEGLVKTGQAPDMFGSFYKKMFKNGGACAFDIEYIDVFDAVKAIKEAGGLAVLAHPGQQQNFWIIPELVKIGLDGLELNHYGNSQKDKEIIYDYANQYGLFLTGGSDYHGKYDSESYAVGDFLSEESGVRSIC